MPVGQATGGGHKVGPYRWGLVQLDTNHLGASVVVHHHSLVLPSGQSFQESALGTVAPIDACLTDGTGDRQLDFSALLVPALHGRGVHLHVQVGSLAHGRNGGFGRTAVLCIGLGGNGVGALGQSQDFFCSVGGHVFKHRGSLSVLHGDVPGGPSIAGECKPNFALAVTACVEYVHFHLWRHLYSGL